MAYPPVAQVAQCHPLSAGDPQGAAYPAAHRKGRIGENLIVGRQATALKQLHIDVRITASVLGRQAGEQGITGQQWQPQLQLAAR